MSNRTLFAVGSTIILVYVIFQYVFISPFNYPPALQADYAMFYTLLIPLIVIGVTLIATSEMLKRQAKQPKASKRRRR